MKIIYVALSDQDYKDLANTPQLEFYVRKVARWNAGKTNGLYKIYDYYEVIEEILQGWGYYYEVTVR